MSTPGATDRRSEPSARGTRSGTRSAAAATTAAIRLSSAGLGLVASIAISRALLPQGRGVYAVAAALAGIAAVLGSAALHRALQYERSRGRDVTTLSGAAFLASSCTGLLGAVAVSLVVLAVPSITGPANFGIVVLALCGAPAIAVSTQMLTLLALAERPAAAAAVALWTTVLQSALLVALALSGVLTPALVIAVGTVTALTGVPLALRQLPGTRPLGPLARALTGELLRRGARYHPGYLAGHLLLRMDVLIVAALHGAGEAGLYSLAVALTEPTLIVTSSIAQAGWGAQARGEGGDAYTARLARTALTVAAVLVAMVALLATPLVPLLFGAAFTSSVPALLLLLPGTLALAAREPLEMAISHRDEPRLSSRLAITALALNVGLNFALVPAWGARGAAVASTVAYGLQLGLLSRWFLRTALLPARALLPRPTDLAHPLGAVATTLRARMRGAR